jgi:hypothetical protein
MPEKTDLQFVSGLLCGIVGDKWLVSAENS